MATKWCHNRALSSQRSSGVIRYQSIHSGSQMSSTSTTRRCYQTPYPAAANRSAITPGTGAMNDRRKATSSSKECSG